MILKCYTIWSVWLATNSDFGRNSLIVLACNLFLKETFFVQILRNCNAFTTFKQIFYVCSKTCCPQNVHKNQGILSRLIKSSKTDLMFQMKQSDQISQNIYLNSFLMKINICVKNIFKNSKMVVVFFVIRFEKSTH